MTYCGDTELGAAVDMWLTKASKINIESVLNIIYKTRVDGVRVHNVGASFGEVDVTAYIVTDLDPTQGHPTWRLAQFVERVLNLPNVQRTRTRILIHDPGHDRRMKAGMAGRTAPRRAGRRARK